MDFFIIWALVLGLIVVPGLINYYVNRYYAPATSTMAPTFELVAASFVLTFAVLVSDIMVVLALSLVWDGLKDEISAFMQLGLTGYGQDRPIALPGVLTAVSIACMAVMALLGALRLPSRFVK